MRNFAEPQQLIQAAAPRCRRLVNAGIARQSVCPDRPVRRARAQMLVPPIRRWSAQAAWPWPRMKTTAARLATPAPRKRPASRGNARPSWKVRPSGTATVDRPIRPLTATTAVAAERYARRARSAPNPPASTTADRTRAPAAEDARICATTSGTAVNAECPASSARPASTLPVSTSQPTSARWTAPSQTAAPPTPTSGPTAPTAANAARNARSTRCAPMARAARTAGEHSPPVHSLDVSTRKPRRPIAPVVATSACPERSASKEPAPRIAAAWPMFNPALACA